jgi:hypothetical protein
MRKEIIKRLEEIKSTSKVKDIWAIEYDGIRLSFSPKSSWSSIGAAKNALRLRMSMGHWRDRLAEIKKLEDEGVIKYIKL